MTWDSSQTVMVIKLQRTSALRAILVDLQCRQVEPTNIDSTTVLVDNTATLVIVNCNDLMHETVKHVTLKVRLLQGCVNCKIIFFGNNQYISDT